MPQPFLWEKSAQLLPKLAVQHQNFLHLPKFCLKNVPFRTYEL